MNLIDHWFHDGKNALPLDLIPNAIFTHPCYASVGMSEEAARQHADKLTVYRSEFRPMDHTLGQKPDRVLIKLLVDGSTDAILGAHMVGEGAGEIIQGVAMAMACGATKASLDATLGIHPTVAEEWVTLRTPS
jgi:glutathione reductase (NADPH)